MNGTGLREGNEGEGEREREKTNRVSTRPMPAVTGTPASAKCLATTLERICFGFLKSNREARSRCRERKKACVNCRAA